MAIIIPSSRIYNKQKSVINNNIIRRAEIRGKSVSPVIEDDATVLRGSYDNSMFATGSMREMPTYLENGTETNKVTTIQNLVPVSPDGGRVKISFASVYLEREIAFASIKLRVNRRQNNLYVSSFSKENALSFSVTGKKTTRFIATNVSGFREGSAFDGTKSQIGDIQYGNTTEEISSLTIESKIEVSQTTDTILGFTQTAYLYSTSNVEPTLNINEENEDFFSINISNIPLKFVERRMQGKSPLFDMYTYELENYDFGSITISGEEVYFVGEKLEININGSRFGIELNETTSVFGSGNFSYTIEGSEIFQEENTYNGKPLNTEITNNLFSSYRNGKETATIRCSIGEYYDENGSLAVSANTERMTFANGDIVVPMVFGAKGKDRPMSLKKDGTPKVFRVVGVRVFYDGAVWQEISLQEV